MFTEKSSEIQKTLSSITAANKKLSINSNRKLETQIEGVKNAISQLESGLAHQNATLQRILVASCGSNDGDTDAIPPSPESMRDLSNGLADLASEVIARASDQPLLNSLQLRRLEEGRANVASAHRQTFGWLLNPSSPMKFESWVRSQIGIYWIIGKASSGKSTLMKSLIKNPDAVRALKTWAGTECLITANFSLWKAGTPMQKSQEGLFTSLLYETLRKFPDIISSVCAPKGESFQPFVNDVGPWTREELWQAIRELKR